MISKVSGGTGGGSYVWDAPVKNMSDIEKIHYQKIKIDHDTINETIIAANSAVASLMWQCVRAGARLNVCHRTYGFIYVNIKKPALLFEFCIVWVLKMDNRLNLNNLNRHILKKICPYHAEIF